MDREIAGKENMHVMQVPTSPSWLKPKPIKLRKKNPKAKIPLPLNEVDVNKDKDLGFIIKSPLVTRNPFKRTEIKRKRETDDEDDDSHSLLWKHVNRSSSHPTLTKSPSPVIPSMFDESALSAFSDNLPSLRISEKETVPIKDKTKILPVDWSLKTKIRFTSTKPFPSRGCFRTFEEVNGTIGFVRCLHPGETDKTSDVNFNHGAKFFQNCLVWMHPSLPWLNLFPRLDHRSVTKQSSSCILDSAAIEVLHSNWCDSFRSLYQLVRLFQCPYFYMCTGNFTALFRCTGAASIPVIHALISPTTKGFRKALKDEGITFTMPFCQSRDYDSGIDDLDESSPTLNEYDEKGEEQDEDADPVDDDEPESWLESLGLSQDDFPSLNKKKRRSEISYKIDHKPESLVYVEDSETQALVNFFLNSNFCTTKVGPMAGIPPTLLAPTAFLGGTLQSLKIRHGKVKVENRECDSVEVTGPLLPNAVHSLCALFSGTQDGDFTAALTPHAPTTPFSMVNPQCPALPCIFAKNNMADCGLPDPFVEQMCSKPEGSLPIHSVKVEGGLFTWS